MGRLAIERLLLLFLIVSSSGADTVGGESANVQSETDPKDKTQHRGLSWFGADGQGGDDKEASRVEGATPGVPGAMIQLIESLPCEPDHEKARAFVSVFGKIDSGNEACAAEADPDSCSGGCCRFGTHFLCDRFNAYPELPCVCNRNTAANHPHLGHLHTMPPVSAVVEEKTQDTAPDSSVTKERDGESFMKPSSSGESQGNSIKYAATEEKEDESDGLLASVAEFLVGSSEQQDASDGGIIESNTPLPAIKNEAVFLTGWGGEPPEDQMDPGAIKHGVPESKSPGNHKLNRGLVEDVYDYDHGPVNQAQWLTPFAEGPTY